MNDAQSLFLILGLIYLSECLIWVHRGTFVLRSLWTTWPRKSARLISPHSLFGNSRGGLILLNPFPPFGEAFKVHSHQEGLSFMTQEVPKRLERFRQKSRWIYRLCNFLFLYLFILTPIITTRWDLKDTWWMLLCGLLALMVTIAILFRRSHQALYPQAQDQRFQKLLLLFLSPLSAIRAYQILSLPLLEAYHPLIAAYFLLPEIHFQDFARKTLAELSFPLNPSLNPVHEDSLVPHSQKHLETLKKFLSRVSLDPKELLGPPSIRDPGCLSYCPRCDMQFTKEKGECPDCPGVGLLRLPEGTLKGSKDD